MYSIRQTCPSFSLSHFELGCSYQIKIANFFFLGGGLKINRFCSSFANLSNKVGKGVISYQYKAALITAVERQSMHVCR